MANSRFVHVKHAIGFIGSEEIVNARGKRTQSIVLCS